MNRLHHDKGLNFIAMLKGGEAYIWKFDDDPESFDALLEDLGRAAGDDESSFDGHDAAMMTKQARELERVGT